MCVCVCVNVRLCVCVHVYHAADKPAAAMATASLAFRA